MSSTQPPSDVVTPFGWRRPKRCEAGHCLEVAQVVPTGIALRNSTRPDEIIIVTRAELAVFVAAAKEGHYDDFCEW